MKPTTQKHLLPTLNETSLAPYRPQFSYPAALARGAIVDVTSWIPRDVKFSSAGTTVRVAVTARLWRRVIKTSLRQKYCETLFGKDPDVIELASRALAAARRQGLAAANFQVCLAASNSEIETEEVIRVEYQEFSDTSGYILIGFPAEFATL